MAEIKGHLTLIGDSFDIEQITKKTELTPTWTKRKDDLRGNGTPFGHCEWGVETEQFNGDNIGPVLDSVMDLLPCSRLALSNIARESHAEWHILFCIRIFDEFPIIELPAVFSRFAAEIDATIGFDTYILGDATTVE